MRDETRTTSGDQCVDVVILDDGVVVRGSDGTELRYTPLEWAAFLAGAKDGEFDGLV